MGSTEPSHQPDPELFEQVAEAITDKLRGVGLHATRIQFATDPETGDKYIVASLAIGDLALSDRVQAPENLQLRDSFAEIEQEIVDQHIAEIQQEIRQKAGEENDDE